MTYPPPLHQWHPFWYFILTFQVSVEFTPPLLFWWHRYRGRHRYVFVIITTRVLRNHLLLNHSVRSAVSIKLIVPFFELQWCDWEKAMEINLTTHNHFGRLQDVSLKICIPILFKIGHLLIWVQHWSRVSGHLHWTEKHAHITNVYACDVAVLL